MYFKHCHSSNHSSTRRKKNQIKYIVVHYTANNGDTARNNLDYYARVGGLDASCHYFVDKQEVCCSVPWDEIAWHCGGDKLNNSAVYYGLCYNSNSLGVEMCSREDSHGKYYFDSDTIHNAAKFIAQLMDEYKIPIHRVIRHYDVTGKPCPAPFISAGAWQGFKNLINSYNQKEEPKVIYNKLHEIPAGEMRDVVELLVRHGIIKGKESGLALSEDSVRMMVYNKRAGLYDHMR